MIKRWRKEILNKFYKYKFEIFTEFIKDIEYIFHYVSELLDFSIEEEAKYFIKNIINYLCKESKLYHDEFIRRSTPYYLIMNIGALCLKKNALNIIETFYDFKIKNYDGNYFILMSVISRGYDGWSHIGKENFKSNYFHPMYSICSERLLPTNIIKLEEFHKFDAYITILSILNQKIDFWFLGCSMYGSRFLTEIYYEYFEKNFKTNADKISFLMNLRDRYNNKVRADIWHGISQFINTISRQLIENRDKNFSY